ncbi:winged helix DNA-binding domain-containing protein [Rugosimonospora africana]|uniref:Winged helix DNA-binding domain-containing protein n=1 Tax=Rugosimonospora africana TaxID=556532 RepID=A0A8J3QT81_9ACTN|nr:winged helix DNA-binding domain-containing protein [Rugosimonospora africana]GIH15350.1 hypothetical protein Raf01_35220 [Rugosimonospora africana]
MSAGAVGPTAGAAGPAAGAAGSTDRARLPLLGPRALGRATLDRQLLLRRARCSVPDAVRHLVGLQGQVPAAPYIGLWSRLEGFELADLTAPVEDRRIVRATAMRATLHLLDADDYRRLRPLLEPVLRRSQKTFMGRHTEGIDPDDLVAAARDLLRERPRDRSELRALLGARWLGHDPAALVNSVQYLLPMVQLPPAGTWKGSVRGPFALAEQWLGQPLAGAGPDELVCRYLAAFGPASVMDVQAWSGLTRLGEVVEPMRGRLRGFRDASGRELFDLPDAPRPDPDTPAPVRFLPQWDNLLLSHADRTRVIAEEHRRRIVSPADTATFLIDGVARGSWSIDRPVRLGASGAAPRPGPVDRPVRLGASGAAPRPGPVGRPGTAALSIRPFDRLSRADGAALTEEGGRLLAFVAPEVDEPEIRFERGR